MWLAVRRNPVFAQSLPLISTCGDYPLRHDQVFDLCLIYGRLLVNCLFRREYAILRFLSQALFSPFHTHIHHRHACMWSSEPNYSSFRFPHQSWRLQGASLSRLSTLLFKWPITLNGVDTNFPLQISYDFHDRFLWALSTTLPAQRSCSIAELSFLPPFFPMLALLMLF